MTRGGCIAILAGAGSLPGLVADRLAARGEEVRILAFRGFSDRSLVARADAVVGLLDVRRTVACLDGWRPDRVALAGGVRRPGGAALLDAFAAIRNREEIASVLRRGDDSLLRAVLGLLEDRGLRVVGIDDLAPDLLAGPGLRGAREPTEADRKAIVCGLGVLAALSPFDVGQALVVRGERVLAVEGPEGTDRMLARAGRLSRRWPLGRPERGAVLVKAAKTGQDRRVDLPAIGPVTVRKAAAAGLSGIAVVSGSTVVIDRAETLAAADRLGLFLVATGAGGGTLP